MTTISVSHRYVTERARADPRAGGRLISQRQVSPRDLWDDPLGRTQTLLQLPALYSPTHYEPSGFVPEPQLDDLKPQEGSGQVTMATPAGPPAADCGTASPCGGRLYGGPARGLTFGLLPNLWINQRPWIDLLDMKRNQSTFFTERTLAAYLSVSDRTIRNWIRRGELPSYKLGASRRIDPADVDAFLALRREEAP
jgi:excisionase family DNA binding protein